MNRRDAPEASDAEITAQPRHPVEQEMRPSTLCGKI
jgi:hypothetical protein